MYNKATLIGNLGKDPEIRSTQSGKKVANFSIATSERYTDKSGQKVEKAEWHNLVVWDKLAEIVEKYLHKGDKIFVEGKIQTRSWEDQAGQKRYTTEIVVNNLVMLGGKRAEGDGAGAGAPAPGAEEAPDLPF